MLLSKETGGSSLVWGHVTYSWDSGGDVTEVPDDLGAMLLGIKGGGYSLAVNPSARVLKAVAAKTAAQQEAEAAARAGAEAAEKAKDAPVAAGEGDAAKDAPTA